MKLISLILKLNTNICNVKIRTDIRYYMNVNVKYITGAPHISS